VAKGILTAPDQLHVSYVHTPVRYAWTRSHRLPGGFASPAGPPWSLVRCQLPPVAPVGCDQQSAPEPVDPKLALHGAADPALAGGRPSQVSPSPGEVEHFRWDLPREEYYLSVCRLVPYKRVDLVVQGVQPPADSLIQCREDR